MSSSNSRTISTWDPEEIPSTTTTDYIKSTASPKYQQSWVNPPSNVYAAAPTKSNTTAVKSKSNQPEGTPSPVLGASISEAPYRASDGSMLSLVSVSFSKNPSDQYFDHVVIWFEGYNGSSSPQSMTQGTTSPIEFLAETTGETVRVTIQSVGSTGISLALDSCPTVLVTLNGVTTAPPVPTITQTLTTTPTGYQFQFATIGGLAQDQIAGYQVFRNSSNTPSGATLLYQFPQTANAASGNITYQDTVPNGITYYYFVRSINTIGLFSAFASVQTGAVVNGSQLNSLGQLINMDQIAADGATYARTLASELQANHLPSAIAGNGLSNPLFADITGSQQGVVLANQYCAKDWLVQENDLASNGNYTCLFYQDISGGMSPYSSAMLMRVNQNLVINPGQTLYGTMVSKRVPIKNGDVLAAGTVTRIDFSATLGLTLTVWSDILIIKADGTLLSDNQGFTMAYADGGANKAHAWYTVVNFPGSGAAYGVIRLVVAIQNTTGSAINTTTNLVGDVRWSNILLATASNPASISLVKYGSMPFTGVSPLSYTSTTSSITFNGSLSGYRSDLALTPYSASYNQSITGLSAGTAYTFYPYYDDNVSNLDSSTNAQTLQWVNGGQTSGGAVGTPNIAYGSSGNNSALRYSLRADHIPIGNGSVAVTTPASGTGGGSGGGGGQGGSGNCPRSDMLVKHKDLGVITTERLYEAWKTGGEHYIASLDGWAKVTYMESSECSEWLEVDFGLDSFIGTAYHNWLTSEGLVIPSCELSGRSIKTTNGLAKHLKTNPIYKKDLAIRISVDIPNVYLAGRQSPCLLTHNMVSPC